MMHDQAKLVEAALEALDAAERTIASSRALLRAIGPAQAPAGATYYDDTNNPIARDNRRSWREWLRRHGVPSSRAGARLLARRDLVDAEIARSSRRTVRSVGTVSAEVGEIDEDALLAQAGLRRVAGSRR